MGKKSLMRPVFLVRISKSRAHVMKKTYPVYSTEVAVLCFGAVFLQLELDFCLGGK